MADAAVELDAAVDGHLLSIKQPDAAAEEGDERAAEAEAELEPVGAFEEERALLGEEEREASDVELSGIDLGFGEVGVGGEDGGQLGRDAPGDVTAELSLVGAASGGVDLEVIAGAAIAVGVEHDGDAVVAFEIAVAAHGVDGDAGGVGVGAVEEEDEAVGFDPD